MTDADGHVWEVAPRGAVTIKARRGTYQLLVDAPHFSSYRVAVEVAAGGEPIVADIRPLPVISGTVVDGGTGATVSGATIALDGETKALTGKDGRFSLEIDPEAWPAQIAVRAEGFGDRVLPAPRARATASLGDVYVRRAATIVAELHFVEPVQVLAVDLVKLRNSARAPGPTVQTKTSLPAASSDRTVRFENVEPGQYAVVVKGREAWERAGARIDVAEGDAAVVHIQQTPFRVRLRTLRGNRPLERARVILRQHEVFWESEVEVSGGEAAITLWQGGRLSATVIAARSVPYRVARTFAADADAEWLLELPDLEIAGSVIDSETRAPVANAAVLLEMRSKERGQVVVSERTGADGAFRFAPVFAGEHTIKAVAGEYPETQMAYSFDEGQQSHQVTIALVRTPSTQLTVLDARGAPIAGATVFVFNTSAKVASGRTGTDGQFPIFIPRSETRDVFVVPRDESLGVIRLLSGAPDTTMRLAGGTSRIVVRIESASAEPLPRITLAVSYDGRLLPVEVMEALSGRGSTMNSDAAGRVVLLHMPPGPYEFRPVAVSAGAIRMFAVPGENLAVMTFAR
jgi:hypothetical protein